MAKTTTAPRRRQAPTPPSPVVDKMPVLTLLTALTPYDKNPRHNAAAVEAVAASIKEYGFIVPIVADSAGVIVAGHTRYAAAQLLGLTHAPVVIADHLNEKQVQAFRVIDNKTAELASWDMDLLATEMTEIMDGGLDLIAFGWQQDELNALMGLTEEPDIAEALGGVTTTAPEEAAPGVAKDPSSVRVSVGEFNFFVPIEQFREWAHNTRKANGFDRQRIVDALAARLGLEARPLSRSERQRKADDAARQKALAEEAARNPRPARRRVPRSAESLLRSAVDAAEA